jgi:lactose/L-arabinose transport system substrate-binding protein
VWVTILSTLDKIEPARGTPFQGDAESIYRATQTRYLDGEYADAQAALDDAASQIASATGLPIAN